MRLNTSAHDYEMVSLVERFLAITGQKPWIRKVGALVQQSRHNQFMREWQRQYCGMEFKLAYLLARQHREGRFPVQIEDDLQYELYAFIVPVVRIYEQLTAFGKNRLRGMLLDGLKPDNHLLSVQHEITTAVHLAHRGYDVQMHDLEKGSGVDFIASLDGAAMEVECKLVTGDVGRKIHRRKAYALHHHLKDTLTRAYKSSSRGLCVRITLPDRLTCGPAELAAIDATLRTGLLSGTATTKTTACEVEVRDFAISESPFNVTGPEEISPEALRAFAKHQLGRDNKEMMVIFMPGKRALLALIESEKPDDVLKVVARDMRETARKQFTGTLPGILAVQFHDLTADQMQSIGKRDASTRGNATGLQVMTHDFLESPNRKHIHTVAYRSHGTLSKTEGIVGSSGPVYFFRNRDNPCYADPRYFIFGE